jgi:hypothetical protein
MDVAPVIVVRGVPIAIKSVSQKNAGRILDQRFIN